STRCSRTAWRSGRTRSASAWRSGRPRAWSCARSCRRAWRGLESGWRSDCWAPWRPRGCCGAWWRRSDRSTHWSIRRPSSGFCCVLPSPRGFPPGGPCGWMPRWRCATRGKQSLGGLPIAQEGAPVAGEGELKPVHPRRAPTRQIRRLGAAPGHDDEGASRSQVGGSEGGPTGRVGERPGDGGIEGYQSLGLRIPLELQMDGPNPRGQAELGDGVLEEADFFRDGVDQGHREVGPRDGERKAREAGARPSVEDRRRSGLEGSKGGQGVENVLVRHLYRIEDGCEVDAGAPPAELPR